MATPIFKPTWVRQAEKYIGLREIKGPRHNPVIVGWLKVLKAWYFNDEEAWCGTFLGGVFNEVAIAIPKLYMQAKAWAKWGQQVPVCYGAIGIMSRIGGGHVTIIVGRTKDGFLLGLGGNQGDMVRISKFDPSRFEAFRYPPGQKLPDFVGFSSLPVMEVNGDVSRNEA